MLHAQAIDEGAAGEAPAPQVFVRAFSIPPGAPWEQARASVEDLPPEVEARLAEIDAALAAFGDGYAYRPQDVTRGGVFVVLAWDGSVRIERGLIRPEDMTPEPEAEDDTEGGPTGEGGGDADARSDDEEDEGAALLSDRLVAELTAYRTASLRDAVAEDPDTALLCVLHALVLHTFFGAGTASCLDIRCASRSLDNEAPHIEDAPAGRRIAARHEAWARQLPGEAARAWSFVTELDSDSRMALLAHCVGLSADAVKDWRRRPLALAHADALAGRLAGRRPQLSRARDQGADSRCGGRGRGRRRRRAPCRPQEGGNGGGGRRAAGGNRLAAAPTADRAGRRGRV